MRVRTHMLFLFVALLGCFSGIVHADVKIEAVMPHPTANDLFDAWSPDGVTYYFAGDAGTILKYDGEGFTLMETPTQYPLFCIHGTSENDIWAAGGNDYTDNPGDRAVYLHYDGQSWTEVSPPVFFDTTYPPEGIFALAPDDVWAVDADLSSALYHYDGESWEIVYPNVGVDLGIGFDAIHAFAPNDIYVVGNYGQIIHFDGTDWTVQLQKDDPNGYFSTNLFMDVWGPDADHVFACANYGQVYRLNKESEQWELLAEALSSSATMTSMAGSSGTDMYFISNTGRMYHYDGAAFSEIAPSGTWAPNVIRKTSADTYIAAGGMGRMEAYNGQWSPISLIPEKKNTFEHITWADGNLWFAPLLVDERAGVFAWNGGLMTEHKLPLGNQQGYVTGLKALSATDVWAGVQPLGGYDFGIFRFDGDNWNAWKPTNKPVPLPFNDLLKTSGGELFLILGGVMGGNPGRIVDEEFVGPFPDDEGMYFAMAEGADGTVYAAGAGGKIAACRNGSWTMENSGTDKDFSGIATGGGYVYAVAADRTAVYKTDDGQWQAVGGIAAAIKAGEDFTGVVHMDKEVFIAILNTPEGYFGADRGVVYRFSQGQAERLSGWISPNLMGITKSDGGGVFITGDGGLLMSSERITRGDVDGNMSVDLRDVLVSMNVQSGVTALERAAWTVPITDIGNDNKVTSRDIVYILQLLSGQRALGK